MKKKKVTCRNCGKCCIVKQGNKWIDCPYLLQYIKGSTRCLIYRHRIGAIIGDKTFCAMRSETGYDYPGCPFNTDKPIHPAYLAKN